MNELQRIENLSGGRDFEIAKEGSKWWVVVMGCMYKGETLLEAIEAAENHQKRERAVLVLMGMRR